MTEIANRTLFFEDFADKVDERFVIVEESDPALALTLAECCLLSPLQQPPSDHKSFSLIFTADTLLPQRLYRLEQDKLGVIDIFLVPVGKDVRGFHYQAVFN